MRKTGLKFQSWSRKEGKSLKEGKKKNQSFYKLVWSADNRKSNKKMSGFLKRNEERNPCSRLVFKETTSDNTRARFPDEALWRRWGESETRVSLCFMLHWCNTHTHTHHFLSSAKIATFFHCFSCPAANAVSATNIGKALQNVNDFSNVTVIWALIKKKKKSIVIG